MSEEESKKGAAKEERRFSQEQYDMLKRCSEKKDIREWNKWVEDNPKEEIWLQRAELEEAIMQGAHLERAHLEHADLCGAHLEGAALWRAHMEGVRLWHAHLEGAKLPNAHLEGASLVDAHLEGADLSFANLQGAELMEANLEGANLYEANVKNAKLWKAYLRDAKLISVHLEDAEFIDNACLQNANFTAAIVNGGTLIWDCEVDRLTDFSGVGLDSMRIDPGTKQLLEYNIRRMNWQDWYKWKDWSKYVPREERNKLSQFFLRNTISWFWSISDYGISTKQIIKTFFQWALIFAAVYLAWGLIDYHLVGLKDAPGIVSNLFVLEGGQEAVSPWLVPFRAFYFSIVTMTTLGFGDMYANAHSFLRGLFGHALLALQVILGYVLLAALVTRFAVLFTAGGPAGKFAEEKKETAQ